MEKVKCSNCTNSCLPSQISEGKEFYLIWLVGDFVLLGCKKCSTVIYHKRNEV